MRGLVFGSSPGEVHRAGRTERSLTAAGLAVDGAPVWVDEALARALCEAAQPLVCARAGAWFGHAELLPEIPPSATGRPVIGLGAIREADWWARHLRRCGGDLQRRRLWPARLPEAACFYVEAEAARVLGMLMTTGFSLHDAMRRVVKDRRFRAVHLSALDVHYDPGLRVLQLVTTIQIGGAERVTLDTAAELSRQGMRVCVAALGRPTRLAFPEPENFVDLSEIENTPAARADAVAILCGEFGADLVHAHLIRAAEGRAIKTHGLPLAMTIHNLPPAWPAGLADSTAGAADFFFACSQAVEAAAVQHARDSCGFDSIPVRTIWNGIDAKPLAPIEETIAEGMKWRAERNWDARDFVIVALANPRPQKRLYLLPEILHALRARMMPREVRLVFVGAHAEGSWEAQQATAHIEKEIERWDVAEHVHWTGSVTDVAAILAAADVLVSPSAYEGLSLAHLEAFAAGVPVVATDVGGIAEVASSLLHLVPADAKPAAFVEILTGLAACPPARVSELPPDFTRYRMAARTRSLYPCVIERARVAQSSGEVWLVTNNFSTGGAQSSARRLLIGLAECGVKVRAFTVQEFPASPTCGREALMRAGIPVIAIPPPEKLDAADAVSRILDHAAMARPHAVLFWNLITSYKILLADGFVDVPIYDVSPGEMYFASLEKYFAQPRPALPYRTPREYGERLAGIVVKYATEVGAASALGVPVHIIRNGIAARDDGQAERREKRSRVIIGTAARISPDKKLEQLIDALRAALPQLPRCELRIAGGVETGAENYARELKRRARGLPVKWYGELPDTAAFLNTLDLFAMISEPAGCPNASLEAMAASLPVVATDVGGASEQVIDGITGRLVPRGDVAAFADALVELALDPEKRQHLGARACGHARENFSLSRMIESYWRLCLGDNAAAEESGLHPQPDFTTATSTFPSAAAVSGPARAAAG